MKIAHIICSFPPYKSGISNAGFYQAKKSADAGYDVTVFTPDYGRQDEDPGQINFIVERLMPVLKHGRAALLPQLLWRLSKFDVVHLHYPFFGGHEIVWLAKMLGIGGKKLVIYYHMDFIAPNMFLRMMSWPTKLIYNSLLQKADKILVSSFDYVSQLGIKDIFNKHKDKFKEIAFGSQFHHQLAVKNELPKNEKIILFVGAMDEAHRFKGVDVLVRAFKKVLDKLPTSRLVLVGEGKLKEEYKQLAKDLGVRQKIDFTSNVLDSELSEYYNLADVVVLSSVNSGEAFGLVLVEAMAHSKPVIASNLPGVRTVCVDQENGLLVEPGNADDLAEKIIAILRDSDMAISMGIKGRQMVDEIFNWDTHAEKLARIYEELTIV